MSLDARLPQEIVHLVAEAEAEFAQAVSEKSPRGANQVETTYLAKLELAEFVPETMARMCEPPESTLRAAVRAAA